MKIKMDCIETLNVIITYSFLQEEVIFKSVIASFYINTKVYKSIQLKECSEVFYWYRDFNISIWF